MLSVSDSNKIIFDGLGTPRFGTNTAGTQLWAWTSDAFGVGTPTGSATVNLRMAGQYFDSESGLFYNWNRYYNPAIGRYISSDPIGLQGGLNTFNYVEASPVMYTDPEGKFIPLLIGLAEETAACLANPICRSILIDIASVATSPQPKPDDKGMCAGDYVPSANANTADEGEREKTEQSTATPSTPMPDPCKGLKNQLQSHWQKLEQYKNDPLSMDNEGVLAKALNDGNLSLANKIYQGRIARLTKEINKFINEIKKCEEINGNK